ncbi:MAG: hypothetical protein PWP23_420 [Candidatus Sumerlaeota bacterium]|nr:hypothetical protein [Candidatus Sumerlaeota bacterium]
MWNRRPKENPETQAIRERMQAVAAQHGPWTGHNIRLAENVYTIRNEVMGLGLRARRFLQVTADILGKPFSELRVLDLACCEGYYAIEFALKGAQVVGIEGRDVHVERANFVRQEMGLQNVEFYVDDVRNLSRAKHGTFDVVICAGILYHLEAPDLFEFLESIGEVCSRLAFFETHIALASETSRQYKGRTYWGSEFREHEESLSPDARRANLWASLDTPTSFWFNRRSLNNAINSSGFSSVLECHLPATFEPDDRICFVGLKGKPVKVEATHPGFNDIPVGWPDTK